MAELALVVPRELAGASVYAYVAWHTGGYAERGVNVGSVVLSRTQARILFEMSNMAYRDNALPCTLMGLALIIESDNIQH